MQAPSSTNAAKKSRSADSFFSQLSAAAAADRTAGVEADLSAGKPARLRVRSSESESRESRESRSTAAAVPQESSATQAAKAAEQEGRAGVEGTPSVTDRRSASRRAEDGPASNRPGQEWVRPDWMSHEAHALERNALPRRALTQTAQGRAAELGPALDEVLRAAAEEKPEALRRAVEKVEETGGAGLAHDASNLLAALMLYSELLSFPDVLPARHRHYADDLKLLAERSHTLINRLVAFGGAVDRERPVVKGPASLVDVLMHCEGLLSTLSRGSLQVTFGAQAALPIAIAAEPLERILVNLVKNATQATRDGGAVRIAVGLLKDSQNTHRALVLQPDAILPGAGTKSETAHLPLAPPRYGAVRRIGGRSGARHGSRSEARTMVLTVDDSGRGMTEPEVQRLLNPLASGPGQRQGIGLRVVRELVAASGGQLRIESRVGVGTRVEIHWPVAEGEAAERPETTASGESIATAAALASAAALPESGGVAAMEMAAEPASTPNCFTGTAALEGGLSEAERRLLTRQPGRQGKRVASSGSPDFNSFNHGSKGAIAC
jgi:signal transduction histidine kinase